MHFVSNKVKLSHDLSRVYFGLSFAFSIMCYVCVLVVTSARLTCHSKPKIRDEGDTCVCVSVWHLHLRRKPLKKDFPFGVYFI